MKKQEISENGFKADLFIDNKIEPKKAIIMLGGSEGGNSWSRIKRPIEYLVKKGYLVLSLAYFKTKGLPKSLEEIPLEFFERAFDWLSMKEGIASEEYAIIGGSKGAEVALVLGSKYPQVKVVVAFSPSCVVWQGIPSKRFEIGKDVKSSWSYKGKDLPFLAYPLPIEKKDLVLLRLRAMHELALQNEERTENATIKVENIQGGILLISGKRDRMWPSTKMSETIIERLKANDFKYAYKHISYDAGHNGIIINKDCWRKTFAFLEEYYS